MVGAPDFVPPDTLKAAAARSQRITRDWLMTPARRRLDAVTNALNGKSADVVARELLAVVGDDQLIEQLFAPLVGALWHDPWFEPPFRVSRDGMRTGAVLFDGPIFTLTATVTSADALMRAPPPRTIIMPGRLMLIRYVRAGGVTVRRWQADAVGPDFSMADAGPCREIDQLVPVDGQIVLMDGRIQGQLMTDARSDMVTLTASIRAEAAPFMREYMIADGALVRLGMVDDRAARADMLLALLRHSGRTDATECFTAAANDPSFFRRWSAMREWLALDVMSAMPRLRAMAADDPHVEVRQAAVTTLATVESHLARVRQCPA